MIIWHVVRDSPIHGKGVFAKRKIPAGTRIIEYEGARISNKEADRRHPTNANDPFHTFFFVLSSGKVIDGDDQGNDARWINHACEANCESEEGSAGKRVYIVAKYDIARGGEKANQALSVEDEAADTTSHLNAADAKEKIE